MLFNLLPPLADDFIFFKLDAQYPLDTFMAQIDRMTIAGMRGGSYLGYRPDLAAADFQYQFGCAVDREYL